MFLKHPMSGCEWQLPYCLRTEQLTFVYLPLALLKTLLGKGIQILMVFSGHRMFLKHPMSLAEQSTTIQLSQGGVLHFSDTRCF
jgi:hypothetical protein